MHFGSVTNTRVSRWQKWVLTNVHKSYRACHASEKTAQRSQEAGEGFCHPFSHSALLQPGRKYMRASHGHEGRRRLQSAQTRGRFQPVTQSPTRPQRPNQHNVNCLATFIEAVEE